MCTIINDDWCVCSSVMREVVVSVVRVRGREEVMETVYTIICVYVGGGYKLTMYIRMCTVCMCYATIFI